MNTTTETEPDEEKTINSGRQRSSSKALAQADIQNLISNNSKRVTLLDKDGSSKSTVWACFKVICVDGKPQEFVQCNGCKVVRSYKSGNTSSLRRHQCSGAANGKQMVLEQFKKSEVPKIAVKQLNKAIAVGLAIDLRPLTAIERRGFKHVAQELINFGARHGFQKASSVLQTGKTLKSYLPELVDSTLEEIKENLKTAPSFPKFTFTTDMWSDQYQQRSFISLTIHYIDKDYNLQSHMLAVDEFPDLAKKSTENIRLVCRQIISRYFENDLDSILDSATAVTDGGSNMIKAFPVRYPCLCHRINLVIGWMFHEGNPGAISKRSATSEKKLFSFKTECPRYQGALVAIKDVVTYFKRSGLNARLQHTLKQDVETRWNSQLTMLESYQQSMTDVKKILVEKNRIDKIQAIDDGAVVELVDFLSLFRKCTEAWSQEKKPTIHNVVLWVKDLLAHVEVTETDSTDMVKLKTQAKLCMEEYLTLDNIYYVAVVFDPRRKKLGFLNSIKRDEIYRQIRELIDTEAGNVRAPNANQLVENVNIQGAPLVPPPPKIPRFLDYEDSDSEGEQIGAINELDRYLEMHVPKAKGDYDVLEFWRECSSLPTMRRLASGLLAIPSSQTSDERVFSTTGSTLTAKRTNLKGSSLSQLTFIHKNYVI